MHSNAISILLKTKGHSSGNSKSFSRIQEIKDGGESHRLVIILASYKGCLVLDGKSIDISLRE